MRKLSKITLLITSLLTLSLATVPVYAEGTSGDDASTSSSSSTSSESGQQTSGSHKTTIAEDRQKVQEDRATLQSAKLAAQTERTTKQAAQQQKRCEKRQTKVNAIRTRIADRGQKQVDLFSTIATRVETFYTDKGKTLSNYDQLVTDVNAKHDAAVAALATIKSTPVTLKCDGTDANGAAASFKDALKTEIQALKAYKTSVKNLIVGVKSVQSDAATHSTGGDQ